MNILVVGHDPDIRQFLETHLGKQGHHVLMAEDGLEAWKLLEHSTAFRMIVTEWMMPGIDGMALCHKVRQQRGTDYTYIIILTEDREQNALMGLEKGADDVLAKPFTADELMCRIRIAERIIQLEKQIERMATIDALTGLLSRRAFIDRMGGEIDRSRRTANPLSMILVDIDRFMKTNETYGHQIGDQVLAKCAEKISKATRAYDVASRYGAEEYAVCLPGLDQQQAETVAERMRHGIADMKVIVSEIPSPIRVTASFGVAGLRCTSEEDFDNLAKRAEAALSRAKEEGGNRIGLAEA